MTLQAEYSAALKSALNRVQAEERLQLCRAEIGAVCDQLLLRQKPPSLLFLRNNQRACRPEVINELIERSYSLRLVAPRDALKLARLACRLARPAATCRSESIKAQLALGNAMANLGNTLRISERFGLSELLLTRAIEALDEVGEPSARALAREFLGNLLLDQNRAPEARRHLNVAVSIHQKVEDKEGQARARLLRAMCCYRLLETEAALQELRKAAGLVDLPNRPSLALFIVHARSLYLEATGQPELAYQLLAQAEDFYRAHASETVWLRGRWVKGRLLLSLNEPEEAALLLEEARRGFLSRQLPYDAALVSLDLALVYLELKRPSVVAALAREMAAVFTAKKVPREATAALLLFAQAAADFQADALLVRRLLRQLSPERRDALR